MTLHFNGIKLSAPDRVDLFLAPALIVAVAAVLLYALGQSSYSWSIIGAFVGGVLSRVMGIQAKRSRKEALSAGLFGVFGGLLALTTYSLLH